MTDRRALDQWLADSGQLLQEIAECAGQQGDHGDQDEDQ